MLRPTIVLHVYTPCLTLTPKFCFEHARLPRRTQTHTTTLIYPYEHLHRCDGSNAYVPTDVHVRHAASERRRTLVQAQNAWIDCGPPSPFSAYLVSRHKPQTCMAFPISPSTPVMSRNKGTNFVLSLTHQRMYVSDFFLP